MLNRFLIVGVGGSGGKTARFLHRELRYRLHEAGWKDGMPAGWQFLQIDVPTVPDGNEPPIPEQLPTVGGYYTALATVNELYRQVDEGLIPPGADEQLLKAYVGWRPDPEQVLVSIEKGAGQFRTLGRMLALGGAAQISLALTSAINRINAPGTTEQLDRLAHITEPPMERPSPIAIIISSIGGGSGAGMVNDVADILRAAGPAWCGDSIGFLYSGDIFEELPRLTRQGIQPNSLGALSELMAGYWNTEATTPWEFAPFARKNIEVGDVGRRGVRYPFLIGRSNGKVSFGQQNDVYASLGRSLGALMMSSTAQDRLAGYVQAQWHQNGTGLTDNTGLRPAVHGETPFNSIGSASVSLGRDRFLRYASQRLAKSSVDHLLRAHHVGEIPGQEVPEEDALMQAVQSAWDWFVGSCGLDELGEAKNQVLEELRPKDRSSRVEVLRTAARTRLAKFPAATAPQWATLVGQDVTAAEPDFIAQDDGALQASAVIWVEQIQHRIEQTTLQALGRRGVGAEVTVGLLKRLRAHVSEVIVDLDEEQRRHSRNAGMRAEGIRGALAQLGTTNAIQPNNTEIDSALRRAIKTLEFGSEARIRSLACTLLRDLAENQVVPLTNAVSSALSGLKVDEHPAQGDSVTEGWPVGESVPRLFDPAVTERLVEGPATYPDLYASLVRATVGVARVNDAVQTAVEQVATSTRQAQAGTGIAVGGGWVEPLELGEVLTVGSAWWPVEFGRIQAASAARYTVNVTALSLLERAEAWVGRRDSPIGAHVHQTLRAYLTENGDAGVLAARRARFMEAFTAALSLAPPLIGVSNGMLNIVHGETAARAVYNFTEIPLDQTDMRLPVVEAMRNLGVFESQAEEDDVVGRIFGQGREQSIEMITWFQAPYQPIVFDSIMKPIAAEWAGRQTSVDGRERFWQWRRARPLSNFVPVGPATRRSMVAGWFLARLLGELTWTDNDEFQPIAITIPELRRQMGFPRPLIGPRVEVEKDLLAAVLESLPLALVACNTSGSLEPLLPYKRLITLGTEADAAAALRTWILKGETPGGTEPIKRAYSPKGQSVEGQSATPSHRKQAVHDYLEGRWKTYVTELQQTNVDYYGFFDIPRRFDLRDDYTSALERLRRIVSAIEVDDDGGEGD